MVRSQFISGQLSIKGRANSKGTLSNVSSFRGRSVQDVFRGGLFQQTTKVPEFR